MDVETDALWFSRVRTYDTTAPTAEGYANWNAEALPHRADAVVSNPRSPNERAPARGVVEHDTASMELVRRESK